MDGGEFGVGKVGVLEDGMDLSAGFEGDADGGTGASGDVFGLVAGPFG